MFFRERSVYECIIVLPPNGRIIKLWYRRYVGSLTIFPWIESWSGVLCYCLFCSPERETLHHRKCVEVQVNRVHTSNIHGRSWVLVHPPRFPPSLTHPLNPPACVSSKGKPDLCHCSYCHKLSQTNGAPPSRSGRCLALSPRLNFPHRRPPLVLLLLLYG